MFIQKCKSGYTLSAFTFLLRERNLLYVLATHRP